MCVQRRAAAAGLLALMLTPSIAAQTSEGVREFTLSPKVVQTLRGKLGFTSVIVLPPDEPIAETTWGDTSNWSVEDSGNVIKVTLLKPGFDSNLNVIMADNRIYTFLLREVTKTEKPDFQLIAKTDRQPGETRTRFIPMADHDAAVLALQEEVASLKTAVTQAQEAADRRIADQAAELARTYPQRLRAYDTSALRVAPFYVQHVWGDDDATWIRLKTSELPTVYERRDGKDALLNPITFPGAHGLTTIKIPKRVTEGSLGIGKAKPWRFVAIDDAAAGTK